MGFLILRSIIINMRETICAYMRNKKAVTMTTDNNCFRNSNEEGFTKVYWVLEDCKHKAMF